MDLLINIIFYLINLIDYTKKPGWYELIEIIIPIISTIFLLHQLKLNKKSKEGEYGINFAQEFFNNEKYKEITEFIDCNSQSPEEIQEKENLLIEIINGTYNYNSSKIKINFKEVDISSYLNLINLIAKLIDNNLLEKKFAEDLFNYQLNLIRQSTALNNYALDYDFKFLYKVFNIPSNKFFVYGVLKNKKILTKELNIKNVKLNYQKCTIYNNYKLFKIKTINNEEYSALSYNENSDTKIEGKLVKINKNFLKKLDLNEFRNCIKKLDIFEEVDRQLYCRNIIKIEVNKNIEFAWTYFGNEKFKSNEN